MARRFSGTTDFSRNHNEPPYTNNQLDHQETNAENGHPPRAVSPPLPPPNGDDPPVRKITSVAENLKHFFRSLSLSKKGQDDQESVVQVSRPVYNLDNFDNEYGYNKRSQTVKEKTMNKLKKSCKCSKERCFASFLSFFPIITWIREYDWKMYPINDLLAGLTVGIMSVPQGLSYTGLVGVPPIYGLYANLVPTFLYVFLGTSRLAAFGTVAVVSLMMGTIRFKHMPDATNHFSPGCDPFMKNASNGSLGGSMFDSEDCFTSYQLAMSCSLLSGFFFIIFGIMRLGFISYYLSDYLVGGFTSGAAIHVFTSQIDYIFGFHLPRHDGVGAIFLIYIDLFRHIKEAVPGTVITSVICIVFLLVVKELLSPRFQKKFRVPIPGELIVVIVGTIVSYFADLNGKYNVGIVKTIPAGFPQPVLPRFDIMGRVFVDVLVLTIVNYSLSISLAKLYASKNNYKVDPYQEFYAYGIVNIVGGCFQSFPIGQSVARSIVYESAQAKSQFAGLIGTIIVLFTVLFLGPCLTALPQACLGAIIVIACVEMLEQMKNIKPLFLTSKIDFSIYMVSFIAVVVLDVTLGLAVSVLYAFFTVIFRTQCPKIRTMGRVSGTDIYGEIDRYNRADEVPGVKVFNYNAPLYYANVENFKNRLYKLCRIDPTEIKNQQKLMQKAESGKVSTKKIAETQEDARSDLENRPKHIVIDCSGFSYVDLMGVNMLKLVEKELREIGVTVYFAGFNPTVRSTLEMTKFYQFVEKNTVFVSVHDAVTTASKAVKKSDNSDSGMDSLQLDNEDEEKRNSASFTVGQNNAGYQGAVSDPDSVTDSQPTSPVSRYRNNQYNGNIDTLNHRYDS